MYFQTDFIEHASMWLDSPINRKLRGAEWEKYIKKFHRPTEKPRKYPVFLLHRNKNFWLTVLTVIGMGRYSLVFTHSGEYRWTQVSISSYWLSITVTGYRHRCIPKRAGRKFWGKMFVYFWPIWKYSRQAKSYGLGPEFGGLSEYGFINFVSVFIEE